MNSAVCGLRVAGTIFGLVCVFHVVRLFAQFSLVVAGWSVPVWLNAVGALATGALGGWLWKLSLTLKSGAPLISGDIPTLSAR